MAGSGGNLLGVASIDTRRITGDLAIPESIVLPIHLPMPTIDINSASFCAREYPQGMNRRLLENDPVRYCNQRIQNIATEAQDLVITETPKIFFGLNFPVYLSLTDTLDYEDLSPRLPMQAEIISPNEIVVQALPDRIFRVVTEMGDQPKSFVIAQETTDGSFESSSMLGAPQSHEIPSVCVHRIPIEGRTVSIKFERERIIIEGDGEIISTMFFLTKAISHRVSFVNTWRVKNSPSAAARAGIDVSEAIPLEFGGMKDTPLCAQKVSSEDRHRRFELDNNSVEARLFSLYLLNHLGMAGHMAVGLDYEN